MVFLLHIEFGVVFPLISTYYSAEYSFGKAATRMVFGLRLLCLLLEFNVAWRLENELLGDDPSYDRNELELARTAIGLLYCVRTALIT